MKRCDAPLRMDLAVPSDAVDVFTETTEKIIGHFQNLMNGMMVEIILREIELYRLRGDKPE